MSIPTRALLGLSALVILSLVGATHTTAQPRLQQLRIVAPAAPGGGWDQTARVMQQVLQSTGRVRIAPVENIPGAAGTVGLARFIGAERGKGDALLISGLIMLAAIVTHHSAVTLDEITPIARLTGEYEVIAVPARSQFRSLADLIDAFKRQPETISWGGGSAGGSDHILAGLVADAVGIAASRVNYVAFSGGGESLSAVVGGQVSVGVSGLAEFAPHIEAGTIRPLAISSGERLPGLDVPTLREQDIAVEFENWRSVVAPPGIGVDDRRRLESMIAEMVHSAEWHDALTRYRWLDRYLTGPAFIEFVAAEKGRVERILRQLGVGRRDGPTRESGDWYPVFVLAGLALAALAAALQRIESADAVASTNTRAGWRPIALLGAGIAFNLALAERAGFVMTSAVLFWCTARAFDPAHPKRDAIFAVAIGVAAYILFARVLELPLPSGPLGGLTT